jgi:hypothetical protein
VNRVAQGNGYRQSSISFGPTRLCQDYYPILGFLRQGTYPCGNVEIQIHESRRPLPVALEGGPGIEGADPGSFGGPARLGQPQSHVSKYELGERRLDFVETMLVCDALEIDFVEFAATFAAQFQKVRPRRDT